MKQREQEADDGDDARRCLRRGRAGWRASRARGAAFGWGAWRRRTWRVSLGRSDGHRSRGAPAMRQPARGRGAPRPTRRRAQRPLGGDAGGRRGGDPPANRAGGYTLPLVVPSSPPARRSASARPGWSGGRSCGEISSCASGVSPSWRLVVRRHRAERLVGLVVVRRGVRSASRLRGSSSRYPSRRRLHRRCYPSARDLVVADVEVGVVAADAEPPRAPQRAASGCAPRGLCGRTGRAARRRGRRSSACGGRRGTSRSRPSRRRRCARSPAMRYQRPSATGQPRARVRRQDVVRPGVVGERPAAHLLRDAEAHARGELGEVVSVPRRVRDADGAPVRGSLTWRLRLGRTRIGNVLHARLPIQPWRFDSSAYGSTSPPIPDRRRADGRRRHAGTRACRARCSPPVPPSRRNRWPRSCSWISRPRLDTPEHI